MIQNNKNNRWSQLSLKEKAEIISSYVKNGYLSRKDIVEDFNNNYNKFHQSQANFIQRLNNNDTRYIQDENGTPMTHRMSYVTEDNGAVMFPEVQDNNGTLEIGDYNTASQRGDTLHVSVPFAEYYSENYKSDYPEFFNQFAYGSSLNYPFSKQPIPAVRFDFGGDMPQYGDFIYQSKVPPQPYNYNAPEFSLQKDWSGIKTTGNRPYNQDYIDYIDSSLADKGIDSLHRAAIVGNVIEESGGNPFAVDSTNTYQGILQWGPDRYVIGKEKDPYVELDNQINYLISTLNNLTDKKSWSHGGKGSGYNSLKDAYKKYTEGKTIDDIMHAFTWGYVRPTGKDKSYSNRLKVAKQVYNKIGQ